MGVTVAQKKITMPSNTLTRIQAAEQTMAIE